MPGPWRRPAETSDDLYPNLVVTDNVVSGSILFHGSRLALWGVVADLVRDGWYAVEDEYDPPCGRDVLSGFLFDLFQARGEFGRLLLVLAEAERREKERPEDLDPPWWEDPELRQPVIEQIRRCLAALDAKTAADVLAKETG